MEVFKISEKALTPYITFVLLLSLMANLAPHPINMGDVGSRVNGFWDDLLGSSDTSDSPPSSTDTGSGISKIFLDMAGIDGESTDSFHSQWIDIQSFRFGMLKPTSSTTMTRRRGDIILEDIIITKKLDKSSPKLMEKCAKGQVISEVVIEFCRDLDGSFETVYAYELTNVLITNFHSSADTSEDAPIEEFSLNFEELTVTYTEFDSDGKSKGNIEFTWKVEEAEA